MMIQQSGSRLTSWKGFILVRPQTKKHWHLYRQSARLQAIKEEWRGRCWFCLMHSYASSISNLRKFTKLPFTTTPSLVIFKFQKQCTKINYSTLRMKQILQQGAFFPWLWCAVVKLPHDFWLCGTVAPLKRSIDIMKTTR